MLSAVITALSVAVMLLIIASVIFSAWREQQRHKRKLATQSSIAPHPLDRHVTAILHLHEGAVVKVEQPTYADSFNLPSSWYTRRRTLVSIGFLIMLLLTLFAQTGLAGGALQGLSRGLGLSFLNAHQSADGRIAAHPLPQTASVLLVRVDSAAHDQYYNAYQLQVWSYSSCSGIAMEEVMNAYGRHLIAADVLQRELDLGVWNVQLGLLREEGIAMTAATFGFNTDASHTRTLQDLITISNRGAPVIVDVRDSYYYPGGHIFVVRGGDSQYVYIADSSPANFQRMTHAMFLGMWQGFSAVLTPKSA
ncbi:MAG: hypothetical protein JOZ18_11545 [Chloroflexi bacterium]|nr:hypothetical protein [Chloroflexota bacterium]